MANKAMNTKRITIDYFDGVNTLVGSNISKKTEISHCENIRSNIVGVVEKRQGTRRLGDDKVMVANYGLFYFKSSNALSNGVFRISDDDTTVDVYYLNSSSVWTKLAGNNLDLEAENMSTTNAESCMFMVNGVDANRYISSDGLITYTSSDIGDSTTTFSVTSAGGALYRFTYTGVGTDPAILSNIRPGDYINIMGENFSAGNKGSFFVTAVIDTNYFTVINSTGVVESDKTIGAGAIRMNNHLTNSPIAKKINYYKDRLYLGDYTDIVNYGNSVMMSSTPLGLASLVDGDHTAPITSLKVTDLKYLKSNDVLDVYRANTKIGTIIVTAKDSNTNTLTINSFATDIKSSDELWIANTHGGKRMFRWAQNPESGEVLKEYDTFKLAGGDNGEIKMLTNINDVMVIGNSNNLAYWNGSALQNVDFGVGCVSDYGYVASFSTLWFIHYTGVYGTTGGIPKLMSAKVSRYFEGATKAGLESSCAGKKGYSVFFSIGNVTLYHPDGSIDKTLQDVVLEYNIRQENWFVHTGIPATQFITYIGSVNTDRLLFASDDTNCNIMEFLIGAVDDKVTSDKEIIGRIDTDTLTLSSSFEQICYLKQVVIELERGAGVKCFVSLDNEPFYEIEGNAVKGCTVLNITSKNNDIEQPPRCRRLKISLRDDTKKIFKLSRIAVIYTETLEQEETRQESYE